MKTFLRHRTPDEVIARCKAMGLYCDTGPFERGSDHLLIRTDTVELLYNAFSGRFFGDLLRPDAAKTPFNSDHDIPEPWYQTLVEFFYTDEELPA